MLDTGCWILDKGLRSRSVSRYLDIGYKYYFVKNLTTMTRNIIVYQEGAKKKAFTFLIVMTLLFTGNSVVAQQKDWMVRLAKIEVDTVYLEQYKAAIEEHTKAAIAGEPGVLTLYAMYEKEHPGRITILEIYANRDAYNSHLKTAHFLKYKSGTLKMIKSLELIDVDPIAFGAKPGIVGRK